MEWIDLADERFMPHGHCYSWEPAVLWSYAISDSIIAVAYFSIPLALLYIYLKRKDFTYVWIMVLFAVFIAGCGITHVFDVVNIWKPLYKLDAMARIITALASVSTAAVLVRLTPRIIGVPTAQQWKSLNAALQGANEELQSVNEELSSANEELQAQLEELNEKDRTIQAYREFERLTETLPQLVWTTNPYMTLGKSMYINRRWHEYTGLGRDKDFNDIYRLCVPEQQQETLIQHWQKSLQAREPFEMEILLKRHDGQYRWHLAKAAYAEEINHWVGTFTDIDDQKLIAEQLALQNKQLTVINTDLDNFIYTASHDLKAPITNLEGLTTVLVKKLTDKFSLDEEQNRVLSMMTASIDRLYATIGNLTEIAKVQKEEVEQEMVSIEKTVDEVCQDLGSLMMDTAVVMEKRIAVDELRFAPKNLRSIFYNLLSNAIKYRSRERRPAIRVETKKAGDYLLIEVSDNGIGLAENNLQKLFTMFKRFHTHVEGSGIGLYIIKRIVENAGGRIEVESRVEVGTTFRIYLPLHP